MSGRFVGSFAVAFPIGALAVYALIRFIIWGLPLLTRGLNAITGG